MTDGQRYAVAFIGAVIVVAAALALIAAAGVRFTPDVDAMKVAARPSPTPALPGPPEPVAPPPAAAPAPATLPPAGGIYRCVQGGKTTYSDTPCPGGAAVDVRPAIDRYATPQLSPPQVAVEANEPALSMEQRPPSAGVRGDARTALCESIRRGIEQIDAAARAGGDAAYQDRLRSERRKLEDARYEHRC